MNVIEMCDTQDWISERLFEHPDCVIARCETRNDGPTMYLFYRVSGRHKMLPFMVYFDPLDIAKDADNFDLIKTEYERLFA